MQEELPGAAALGQRPDEAPSSGAIAELVLDSHRLVGEVQYGGAPRRLVDVLNATDGVFVVLRNGVVDELHGSKEEPRHFQVMHVQLNAILFALPRTGPARMAASFEVVAKVPVLATIVLPGFEITGKVYLAPDANAAQVPLLASRHFIPLTDTTIVTVGNRGKVRHEPIVVVNLTRALVYTPGGLAAP